jgi:hypothetical protein
MGTSASRKENIINENINIPVTNDNGNNGNDQYNSLASILIISLSVTLVTMFIIYKLKIYFKKQVQKIAITRV